MKNHIINIHQCKIAQYKCSYCQKLYNKKESMQKHQIAKHVDTTYYQCAICVVKFATKENMNCHGRRKHHE